MADHARIADLVYRIRHALDKKELDEVGQLMSRLAQEFDKHSQDEEAGLFRQVGISGEETEELDCLLEEHARLRPGLREERLGERPDRLRALLDDLTRHAEMENNDFFPFVLQSLSNDCWDALANTHWCRTGI
jgi:hemerythrin-like domain-containing protein